MSNKKTGRQTSRYKPYRLAIQALSSQNPSKLQTSYLFDTVHVSVELVQVMIEVHTLPAASAAFLGYHAGSAIGASFKGMHVAYAKRKRLYHREGHSWVLDTATARVFDEPASRRKAHTRNCASRSLLFLSFEGQSQELSNHKLPLHTPSSAALSRLFLKLDGL